MTPMGLSVLVNACLVLVMARAFTAPDGPARRYLAVELQIPAQAAVHHITRPQIKQIVLPAPQPVQQSHPQKTATSKPIAQPRPSFAALPSKQEKRTAPTHSMTSLALPQTHAEPSGGSGPGAASTGIGGTPGAGPGVYSGPNGGGSGAGGHSSGPSQVGNANSDGHGSQPAPVHGTRPVAPEPPKPAPRGESRDARITRQSKPAYPSAAREDGVEGTVVLEVSVGADGKVTSARVDKSSGDRRLDRAAAEAVQRWSYEPSLKDGTPIVSSMRVRVQFKLE
jgi:TonB family protein